MPDMLVRLKRGKTTFEVLTREGAVTKYRDKSLKSLDDVLVSGDDIFTNVKKGQKASRGDLIAAFQTDDARSVLETIILKGDVQVGANERQDKIDQKRAEIVAFIHKHYVDPGNGQRLPLTRIENALNILRPRIDPDKPAQNHVTTFATKLTEIMPMRKAQPVICGVVSVPREYIGAASGVIRKYGRVTEEEFGERAKWTVAINAFDLFIRDLARATKGDYEFTAAGDNTGPVSEESKSTNKAGGRKPKKGRGRK